MAISVMTPHGLAHGRIQKLKPKLTLLFGKDKKHWHKRLSSHRDSFFYDDIYIYFCT